MTKTITSIEEVQKILPHRFENILIDSYIDPSGDIEFEGKTDTPIHLVTNGYEPVEDISSNFNEIMGSPLSEFCTQDSIESALDPLKNVDMRDSLGGPSPTIVLNSISNAKNNLKSDFSLHTAHKEKIDQSKEKLIQEAMSYLK